MLKEILDKNLLKEASALFNLARKLFDSKYGEVSAVWSEVIISAIKVLPLDLILNEILPWAMTASGLAQPSELRIWCCQLLGAMSPYLGKKK